MVRPCRAWWPPQIVSDRGRRLQSGDPVIDDKPTTAAAAEPSQKGLSAIGEIIRTWLPALLAVVFIRMFIFEPYRIPSGSMVPTLLIGDHVLVTKFSYGIWLPFTRTELVDLGDPKRGDIVVFRYPKQESMTYIKRVVGLPGDSIRVRDNRIVLDGEELPTEAAGSFDFVDDHCRATPNQRYLETVDGRRHEMLTNTHGGTRLSNKAEITVPPNHVFVMGDNRDHSEDSRGWGFVRYDQIKGKAHFVWFSWDSCSGGVGSVRGDRWFRGLYPEL